MQKQAINQKKDSQKDKKTERLTEADGQNMDRSLEKA